MFKEVQNRTSSKGGAHMCESYGLLVAYFIQNRTGFLVRAGFIYMQCIDVLCYNTLDTILWSEMMFDFYNLNTTKLRSEYVTECCWPWSSSTGRESEGGGREKDHRKVGARTTKEEGAESSFGFLPGTATGVLCSGNVSPLSHWPPDSHLPPTISCCTSVNECLSPHTWQPLNIWLCFSFPYFHLTTWNVLICK